LKLKVGEGTLHTFDEFNTQGYDDSRSENWRVKWYKDPTQPDEAKAYGIEIQNVEQNDHGSWKVQVSLEQADDEVSYEFNITVAHMPEAVEIDSNDFEIENGEVEIVIQNENDETYNDKTLFCKTNKSAPAPAYDWIILDNDNNEHVFNYTVIANSTISNEEDESYIDFEETIQFVPALWMDGKRIRCNTEHPAYQTPQDNKYAEVKVIIQGRPVPNNYPEETISFEEPKRGDEGLLLFPFHSNPAPTNISWDIKGEGFLSSNGSSGRFTAEGWDTYNGTLPDYMTRTLSTTGTQFVAKLRIDKLKTSDSGDIHHLMVVNQYGNTSYEVQIQHIKKGGLNGGEIAGIVIGCIAAVMLVGVVAILVIRRKNLKKAKERRERRNRDENQ